jgi:hypothetical protein
MRGPSVDVGENARYYAHKHSGGLFLRNLSLRHAFVKIGVWSGSMPIAPDDIKDPRYWLQRAEDFRVMAERMSDERAKQALLSVADAYDRFAVSAAMGSIYERAVSRVIDEMNAS